MLLSIRKQRIERINFLIGLIETVIVLLFLVLQKSEEKNTFIGGYSKGKILLIGFVLLLVLLQFLNLNYYSKWTKNSKFIAFLNKLVIGTGLFYFIAILFIVLIFQFIIMVDVLNSESISILTFIKYFPPILLSILLNIHIQIFLIIEGSVCDYWIKVDDEGNHRVNYQFIAMNTLKVIMFFIASYYLFKVIWVIISRINFPFELEYMEGGSLIEVKRILDGMQLYIEPSMYYIPYIYTPLYFYVSALVAWFTGLSFLTLRMVSAFFSIGIAAIIYLFVNKASKDHVIAFIAVGIYSSTFVLSGSWFDIARVDCLFLFLLLLGYYLCSFQNRILNIMGGITLGLSILTKQTAIIAIVPLFLYLLIWNKKNFLKILLPFLITTIFGLLLINAISNGWFFFYIFDVPSNYHFSIISTESTFIKDFFYPELFFLLLSLIWLYLERDKNEVKFIGLMFLGFTACSFFSRANPGGYTNSVLPFCAAISIMAALGINTLIKRIYRFTQLPKFSISFLIFSILLVFQFISNDYSFEKQLPRKNDLDVQNKITQYIKSMKGEVYLPFSSYLNLSAGKKTYAHWISIQDFYAYFGEKTSNDFGIIEQINKSFKNDEFDAVILAGGPDYYGFILPKEYQPDNPFGYITYRPVTGTVVRLTVFYKLNK